MRPTRKKIRRIFQLKSFAVHSLNVGGSSRGAGEEKQGGSEEKRHLEPIARRQTVEVRIWGSDDDFSSSPITSRGINRKINRPCLATASKVDSVISIYTLLREKVI